jgi:hypothetical protein
VKGAPRWPICLEKGGVPTAHKVEGCRLSVKARVADFPQSRDAVRRCPPWLQPSWEEGTGSRASRPRVLSACELRLSAREEKVFSTERSPIFNFTLKNSYSQSTRRWPFSNFMLYAVEVHIAFGKSVRAFQRTMPGVRDYFH